MARSNKLLKETVRVGFPLWGGLAVVDVAFEFVEDLLTEIDLLAVILRRVIDGIRLGERE